MNILITSAGRRVSLVRAFQNELKKLYPSGIVYTTDMSPELSSACQVADGFFKVKRVSDSDYIQDLLKLCIDNGIKLIIPTIDTELKVLSESKSNFEEYGIQCLVSDYSIIKDCRDKRKTHKLFERLNVNFAEEYSHDNPKFPLFIKPIDGSCSKDLYYIKDSSELTANLIDNEDLMFLEYIDPKENKEYTLDLYFDRNNNLKCIVPRERIEVRSGEINKGKTTKNYLVEYVLKRFEYVQGFVGCITLQLFYNEEKGNVCGIEINPRFGGGYPLSYSAGANFPKWVIQEYFLDQKIEFFNGWENNLLMLRYDDEILIHNYAG
ncbi:MAG: ATP-grasp domain-containing protein [Marinifilaceae bacterium]